MSEVGGREMVTLSQFDETVYEIKRTFYHLIKHPYLDLYLADPMVDEDKIRFLFAMLQGELPNGDVELYTISTLLVQAALDIHEGIPLHNVTETFERKKGQLEVLAGDYYSSLYYYLLAKNEQLPMVQVFSHTIQDINECKMNIYGNHGLPFAEVEENVVFIESILLQKIAAHFSRDGWGEIMKDFFYLKRLLFERKEWLLGNTHTMIQSLQSEIGASGNLLERLDEKMNVLKDRIVKNSKIVGTFERFIIELVDDLMGRMTPKEKIVEER